MHAVTNASTLVIACLQDVDDIHEYLLLKGVDAVSIHGGKEQEERNEAIRLFKVHTCQRVYGVVC